MTKISAQEFENCQFLFQEQVSMLAKILNAPSVSSFKSANVHKNHRSQKVTNNNLTTLRWSLLTGMREIMIKLSRSWQPLQQNGN
jgi:hypothetical protein